MTYGRGKGLEFGFNHYGQWFHQSGQCNEFPQSSKGFQDYESLWGGDRVEVLGEY